MRRAVAFALGAVLVSAACGVPTDVRPRTLPPDEVPFGLLVADPTSTTTTVPPGSSSRVVIFLVAGDNLVKAERVVAAPASVEKVLKALVSGPLDSERARGLATAINPATMVLGASVESDIATIDLSRDFAVGSTTQQAIVALAQIVYTATELANVTGVRFTLDGNPAQVPQGDGTITSAPVGRATYASYAPL